MQQTEPVYELRPTDKFILKKALDDLEAVTLRKNTHGENSLEAANTVFKIIDRLRDVLAGAKTVTL